MCELMYILCKYILCSIYRIYVFRGLCKRTSNASHSLFVSFSPHLRRHGLSSGEAHPLSRSKHTYVCTYISLDYCSYVKRYSYLIGSVKLC